MKKYNRYRQMEKVMTYVLLDDLGMFIIYLFAAGFGVIWLKAITAIITILVSGLCLCFLYLTQELLKQRSFWMSTAAGAILLLVLISLILNFPSPNPYNDLAASVSAIIK